MSSKTPPLSLIIQELLSVHALHISRGNSKGLSQNRCGNIESGQTNAVEIMYQCWQEIYFFFITPSLLLLRQATYVSLICTHPWHFAIYVYVWIIFLIHQKDFSFESLSEQLPSAETHLTFWQVQGFWSPGTSTFLFRAISYLCDSLGETGNIHAFVLDKVIQKHLLICFLIEQRWTGNKWNLLLFL